MVALVISLYAAAHARRAAAAAERAADAAAQSAVAERESVALVKEDLREAWINKMAAALPDGKLAPRVNQLETRFC